ncbi:MAG: hypothetical protein AMJ55_10905 [Gammaproteobacteria bacterium SG8_15]|nr:MAG: hypothetical protein AMJ55_10905 [Gammaproteobacteria bacterium SG8_15]
MAKIKITINIKESSWKALKQLAKESNKTMPEILTEAINDYVRKHRVYPSVLKHLEQSVLDNADLGHTLAEN